MARGGGNAIASAAVTLTANADGLVTGLNQAEARLKQFGGTGSRLLKSLGDGVGDKPLKKLDKWSGDLGLAGLAAGGLGAALVAVGRAAFQAFDTVQLNKFHHALDGLEYSFAQLERARAKANDRILDRAGSMGDRTGDYLNSQIPKARAEAARRFREMQDASARLRALESNTYNKFLQGLPGGETFISGVKGDVLKEEAAKAAAEQATRAYESQRTAVERLEDALRKLRDAQQDEANAAEQAIREEHAQRAIDLQTAVTRLTQDFELQAETLNMTAEAAQIYALKMKGASDAQLAEATAAAQRLAELRDAAKGPRFAGAVEMGSREAYSIEAAARYGGKESPAEAQKRTNQLLEELNKNTIDVQKEIEKLQLAWEVL